MKLRSPTNISARLPTRSPIPTRQMSLTKQQTERMSLLYYVLTDVQVISRPVSLEFGRAGWNLGGPVHFAGLPARLAGV